MDARRARWSGSSALVGGVLLAAKGACIAAYDLDLDFTAFAIAAFALASWGVAHALPATRRSLRIARHVGAVVAIAGALALVGFLALGTGPEGVAGAGGIAFAATYAVGTFGALATLLLAAPTATRERALGLRRHAPLLAGALTVPLMGVGGALGGDGWSLMLPGALWMAFGLALIIEWGEGERRPA